LHHLYTFTAAPEYRQYLAEGILIAEDLGLGLPPSLLGANPETVRPDDRTPCPSPVDSRIRVANLSCGGKREILAVNCSAVPIGLAWEGNPNRAFVWSTADGREIPAGTSPISAPARGWLLGTERTA
jgi:hypothetical protein